MPLSRGAARGRHLPLAQVSAPDHADPGMAPAVKAVKLGTPCVEQVEVAIRAAGVTEVSAVGLFVIKTGDAPGTSVPGLDRNLQLKTIFPVKPPGAVYVASGLSSEPE